MDRMAVLGWWSWGISHPQFLHPSHLIALLVARALTLVLHQPSKMSPGPDVRQVTSTGGRLLASNLTQIKIARVSEMDYGYDSDG